MPTYFRIATARQAPPEYAPDSWRGQFMGYASQIALVMKYGHDLHIAVQNFRYEPRSADHEVRARITNMRSQKWTRTVKDHLPPAAAAAELLHWLRHAGLAESRQDSGRFEWE